MNGCRMKIWPGKAYYADAYMCPQWMFIPEDINPTRELSTDQCKLLSKRIDAWIEDIIYVEAAWADMKAKRILCIGSLGEVGDDWFIVRPLSREERQAVIRSCKYEPWRKLVRFDYSILKPSGTVTDYRIHSNDYDSYLGSVLTEQEAKNAVAELYTKNRKKVERYGMRYGYTKYTRRAYSAFEEQTGLPDWAKE